MQAPHLLKLKTTNHLSSVLRKQRLEVSLVGKHYLALIIGCCISAGLAGSGFCPPKRSNYSGLELSVIFAVYMRYQLGMVVSVVILAEVKSVPLSAGHVKGL